MRCTAINRIGSPCGKYAIKGGTVCNTHGGSAPQVKVAAKRREIMRQAQSLVASQYGDDYPPMEDPAEELLRLASESVALKDVLAGKAAELATVSHENRAGDSMVQATLTAYLGLLRDVGDLLVKINRLGIGDHHNKMRDDAVLHVVGALRRALAAPEFGLDLGLQQEIAVRFAEEAKE